MAGDYQVQAVTQTQALGPTGNLIDQVEASFVTIPENAQGIARVNKTGDWAGALTAAIEAEVAQLKAVFGA